jgi:voltage-gated potassium channel
VIAMPGRQAIKRRVFDVISRAEEGDGLSRAFDLTIMSLIALSVLSIILQSFESLAGRYAPAFTSFEAFCVVVFTLEYLARIWTADLLYPGHRHPHRHHRGRLQRGHQRQRRAPGG